MKREKSLSALRPTARAYGIPINTCASDRDCARRLVQTWQDERLSFADIAREVGISRHVYHEILDLAGAEVGIVFREPVGAAS